MELLTRLRASPPDWRQHPSPQVRSGRFRPFCCLTRQLVPKRLEIVAASDAFWKRFYQRGTGGANPLLHLQTPRVCFKSEDAPEGLETTVNRPLHYSVMLSPTLPLCSATTLPCSEQGRGVLRSRMLGRGQRRQSLKCWRSAPDDPRGSGVPRRNVYCFFHSPCPGAGGMELLHSSVVRIESPRTRERQPEGVRGSWTRRWLTVPC